MEISTDTVIRGQSYIKREYSYHRGTAVLEKEEDSHDLYAIVMKKLDSTVDHISHIILTLHHLLLSRGGAITCTATGIRKYFAICSSNTIIKFHVKV